ncbi:MAG TPA: hypothetical protein VFU02_02075 [Polyangiaceae bacterium]|nr:hypothetical protein [Polyangiaceae bacterium]
MTTRPNTTRPTPEKPPSEGVFQVVVECCVYLDSSNRFLPARALERKARLRPATLFKTREPFGAPGTRQRVA